MRMLATKRQILSWFEGLIDARLPAAQVWHAAEAIEDFVTWWQATRQQPWDPRGCTENDWISYVQERQADPSGCPYWPWANAFWRWAREDAGGPRDA